jgi:hypothetical protein
MRLHGLLLLTLASAAHAAPTIDSVLLKEADQVRAAPRINANSIGWAHKGEVYATTEQARPSDPWVKIQYGRQEAWVRRGAVNLADANVQRIAERVMVNAGPGTRFRDLGILERGDRVAITDRTGDWRRISYRGHVGWFHVGALTASPPSPTFPQNRSRAGYVQMPASGVGFYAYSSSGRRWGRPTLVYGIIRAGVKWQQARMPRMGVGEISLMNGGDISGHVSHERGVDVDMRLVRDSGEGPVNRFQGAYNRTRTGNLIRLFKREIPTQLVLFNDLRVGGVLYWPNHDDHFHLRMRG